MRAPGFRVTLRAKSVGLCGVLGLRSTLRSISRGSLIPLPVGEVRSARWALQNLHASNLVATQFAGPMVLALLNSGLYAKTDGTWAKMLDLSGSWKAPCSASC